MKIICPQGAVEGARRRLRIRAFQAGRPNMVASFLSLHWQFRVSSVQSLRLVNNTVAYAGLSLSAIC